MNRGGYWTMMKRTFRFLSVVVAIVAMASAVPSAYGQRRPRGRPAARNLYSNPDGLQYKKPWKPWLVATLCTIAIAALAFKKPGRSHLD